eukprot:m.18168 g.18168  ORF g.18168 m.18168 type:complete len:113 (+) comp11404_c0_seq2:1640-1978(+)
METSQCPRSIDARTLLAFFCATIERCILCLVHAAPPGVTAAMTRLCLLLGKQAQSADMPYCMTTCDGCGHCGAGVPKTVTKCKDLETQYIDKWIAEAKQELSSAAASPLQQV